MLEIKISKKESVLQNIELYEPVCLTVLELLLNSTILQKQQTINGEFREDERLLLGKYKRLIKKDEDGGDVACIKYTRKKWCGRVSADKGVGLVMMRGVVRHTLANAVGFRDIDIKNAHPEFIVQICKAKGLSIKILEDYVNNRDGYLEKLMKIKKWKGDKTAVITRDTAKSLPLRLMYLGTLQAWAFDNGINLHDIPEWVVEWSDKIVDELTKIANQVIEQNPKLVKEVEKGVHNSSWNKTSAVLSSFLQEYENRVLETCFQYALDNGYIQNGVAVLCYDGFMIKTTPDEKKILDDLSNAVLKHNGFKLTFVPKDFDRALTVDDLQKVQITDDLLDENELKKFNSSYIQSLGSYRLKKIYFEKFVSKVMRPDPVYVYIENDGDDESESLCFYSKSKIEDTFSHIKSGEKDPFTGQDIKLMTKWLNDENIRVYNRMDFIPYNDKSPIDTTIFNLFRGFNPKIYTEYDKKKKEKILKPFHDLGIQLSGGDEGHYRFLSQYIADIFQNPQKKNPIAFIIKGKQGTGKNMWLNGVGKTLGAHHYITSSNPKDFFGDYAEGFYHKLLVNMNECEGKDTFDFEGKIKSFITEDTITLNRKFVCPITINNLARLILFSNKPAPIPIDVRSKDRRYVVYETTEHYLDQKYGAKFWTKLKAHMETPEFIACLYDYYNTMDLTNYNIRKRPITRAYIEMCKLYVPVEALFIANKIEEAKEHDLREWNIYKASGMDSKNMPDLLINNWKGTNGIKGEDLYNEYMEYCKKYGFYKDSSTYSKHIKSFYSKIHELNLPILSVKTSNITKFRFDGEEVLSKMKESKWIDYDAEDVIEESKTNEEGDDFDDYFEV